MGISFSYWSLAISNTSMFIHSHIRLNQWNWWRHYLTNYVRNVGMVKRFKTFTNPLFIAWYFADSQHLLASAQLKDGEMMGACPHCWSILAIKPLELNTEDKCPQCGGMLVSEETAKQFSDDEE